MATFSQKEYLVLFFFPALLLALWLTPLVIRFSHRFNAFDVPDHRKVHTRAVARLGGLSMFVAVLIPVLFSIEIDRRVGGFLLGLVVAAGTGILDDVFKISSRQKFAGEILASLTFVLVSGVSLGNFGNLFGFGDLTTGVFAVPVTIFCMVGVMNALNLSDGLDGLAAGLTAIACGFLGLSAFISQDFSQLAIVIALLGAVVGFLRYNSFPARLFMGDSGSLVLGFSLAALSVLTVFEDGSGIHQQPITVAGVLALPIIDTLVVMSRRAYHGRNPFGPDRTHLHHRLMDLGLPHAAVVSIMYATMAMFGSVAWSIRFDEEWVRFLTTAGLGVLVYGTVYLAQHSSLRFALPAIREARKTRFEWAHNRLAHVARRSARAGGWAVVIGLVLPAFFLTPIQGNLGVSALSAGFFVTVFFPWRSSRLRSPIVNGLIFIGLTGLLSVFHLLHDLPSWVPGYLLALSVFALGWVVIEVKYAARGNVLPASSFELLCIGTALFVAVVTLPTLEAESAVVKAMLTVCVESIVFLLALKIFIKRNPEGRYLVLTVFLVAFGLLAGRGQIFRTGQGAAPREGTREKTGLSFRAADGEKPIKRAIY